MTYEEGTWHAIIGLDPQYEHMKGCQAYESYMKGYNKINNIKDVNNGSKKNIKDT